MRISLVDEASLAACYNENGFRKRADRVLAVAYWPVSSVVSAARSPAGFVLV